MRNLIRIAVGAAALALVAATAAVTPAGAQTAGVGTSLAGTTVLSVQLGGGSLLSLKVLADEGRSTIDASVADPSAFSRLELLSLNSDIAPAINTLDDSIPVVESRTPGGEPSVETAALTVAVPPAALAGAGSLASGSITPAKLTSSLDAGAAASSLLAEIADIDIAGGLLSVDAVGSNLSTAANPTSTTASRTVGIDAVTVLDLGAVLQGLGIDLSQLPVDTVLAIVDELGLPVDVGGALPEGSSIADYVNGLRNTIDLVNDQTDLTDTVDSILSDITDLLAPTGITAPSTGAVLSDTLDDLEALLGTALDAVAAVLDGAPLLALEGVTVGVATAATDTLENTTATVTGAIGKVRVGSIEIDGVDLLAATQAVTDLVNTVEAQIGSVLALVDADLANLVDVAVLEKETSVTTSDGYNRARAGIVGVAATITPPANLAEIVATVTSATDTLGSLADVSALSNAMNDLESTLNLGVSALSQPSTVRAVEVLSASDFRAASAPGTTPTPVNELPRTGGAALPLLLGAAVLAPAVFIRRFLRR